MDRQFRFYCAVVVHKEQLSPVSRYYGLNLVSCKDQLLFKEGEQECSFVVLRGKKRG